MTSTVTSELVDPLHRAAPRAAAEMIERLGLAPHPEGGHYRETWRGGDRGDRRSVGTAIMFLLAAGERSHWHRVDADEVWLHHDGDPLVLSIAAAADAGAGAGADAGAGAVSEIRLGSPSQGATPQAVVPAGAWQSAAPATAGVGADGAVGWTLVSCVVVPGFEFDGFELAPPGWSPPR